MPTALMAQRSAGAASTMAPSPSAHSSSSAHQPTGTDTTKRMAAGRPRLAARAVDSVVLGPGVKLMAVASTSRAVNSTRGMGGGRLRGQRQHCSEKKAWPCPKGDSDACAVVPAGFRRSSPHPLLLPEGERSKDRHLAGYWVMC